MGKKFWRSLEEIATSEHFKEYLHREFPEQASEWTDPMTRRHFLSLMGASFALAGLTGCGAKAPDGKIMPYVRAPENMVPGKPLFYASSVVLSGLATGVLVESHEGRPTKVEGNPDHPASLGATDSLSQASILDLYDPDRSQSVTYRGQPRAWNESLRAIRKALEKEHAVRGKGLRILTGSVSSPTLKAQLQDKTSGLLSIFPEAKWYQYDPTQTGASCEGTRRLFGKRLNPVYRFSEAHIVLSLDSDFLQGGPGHLRYVRDFMVNRRPRQAQPTMNRLYVVESMPTNTGAVADHRLPLPPAEVAAFTRALAVKLKVLPADSSLSYPPKVDEWLNAVAEDLEEHRGSCLVVPGEHQPPEVHALAHAMNRVLDNLGKTVVFTEPPVFTERDGLASLRDLAEEMTGRKVNLILILDANPVFTAPGDIPFGELLKKVPLKVHLGLYRDETASLCDWHIPQAHYLESWGDARAFDGTVSLIQPLIAPLYGEAIKTVHDFLAEVILPYTEGTTRTAHELIKAYWQRNFFARLSAEGFEAAWEKALHDGMLRDSAFPVEQDLKPVADWTKTLEARPVSRSEDELSAVFRFDPTIYDGRFANNGWLQELPKPITKLTWDNAVIVGPETAKKYGLEQTFGEHGGEHGETLVYMVEIECRGVKVTAPVFILPGHADKSVTLHLGYGRSHAGRVGNGTGFNFYPLWNSQAPYFAGGLKLKKLDQRFTLACTQLHHGMLDRHLVETGTLLEFQKNRDFLKTAQASLERQQSGGKSLPMVEAEKEGSKPSDKATLYKPYLYAGYKWAMAVDLSSCTGCGACVVACQAENNIPVVGKTEVTRGREMHWLRVDRYFQGDADKPEDLKTYFQPVPCMHCENAPCELVCPVGATVHSDDGLNDMVYNRCVGTRYCSNNCPYKVRRFNFLQYADYATESLKLLHNPEVTVRSRGVMEKCTYCVQRIRAGEIEAKKAERTDPARPGVAPIRDGEVQTACQAACPSRAIIFGDLNDPSHGVNKWKSEPTNYALLGDLNTVPRTTYLAAIRNPNPKLKTI